MFLRILKLDLKKRKLTNILLLLFIILATIFSSSGLNTVAAVMNGTDYYFDKAGVDDYTIIADSSTNSKEILDNEDSVDMDISVNVQDFYLNEVMEQVENYYIDKLETMHTFFNVEKFNNCLLKGDKDRIVEVIQNVIENSIKYGDGKKITIVFSEEDNCILITILNTGCNLKEDELPHIFDSFYRGSNTNNQDGSGLGLYICKCLMRKMDGDIYSKIRENNIFESTIVIRKI